MLRRFNLLHRRAVGRRQRLAFAGHASRLDGLRSGFLRGAQLGGVGVDPDQASAFQHRLQGFSRQAAMNRWACSDGSQLSRFHRRGGRLRFDDGFSVRSSLYSRLRRSFDHRQCFSRCHWGSDLDRRSDRLSFSDGRVSYNRFRGGRRDN